MSSIERRLARGLELRAAEGGVGTLRGYAALFNARSEDLGGFVEQIAPGAFAASLGRGDDIRALGHHSSAVVLGRRSSGTLRIEEDDKGLAVEIDLPDTQGARDIAALVARGDITGMSFGFETVADTWDRSVDPVLRTLREVNLFEVSVVAFPAYPDTAVALRSLRSAAPWSARFRLLQAELDQILRG